MGVAHSTETIRSAKANFVKFKFLAKFKFHIFEKFKFREKFKFLENMPYTVGME